MHIIIIIIIIIIICTHENNSHIENVNNFFQNLKHFSITVYHFFLLPPLHNKLGLMKNFFQAMN